MPDPSTTGPNLGLPLDIPLHSDGWDVPYNNAMLLLDTLLGGKVLSVVTATPPGSPDDGDAYVIAASPTGAWSGKAKNLTVYHNSAWNFFPPKKGMRVLNLADSKFYYYNNSAAWAIEDNTGPAGPEPFDTLAVWVTSTVYTATAPASYVSHLGSSYVCLTSHTAGTFATDLGAGKWGLVAEVGSAGATGTNGTNGSAGATGLTGATGTAGSAGATGAVPFGTLAPWVTATAYSATAPASYVSINGSSYVCLTGHTSGTFATDLAAAKWGLVASAGLAYDLSLYVQGQPTATLHVYSLMMARAVTMPANLVGSYGFVATNPASTAAFDAKKNGTTCATASISTSGVFTFTTTGGTSVSFAAGDRLDIYAPGTADATLADIAVTLSLTRP